MLHFVTGNKYKIAAAHTILDPLDISFQVVSLKLTEIQSDVIAEIAVQKAEQAYSFLKEPLVIKDDGWHINSLNGFPGPYMKYINDWFDVEDYQNLLASKTIKKVIFTEVICYKDKTNTKIFQHDIHGRFYTTPRGHADHPFMRLATFRKDGLTMAEASEKGLLEFDETVAWKEFAEWYKSLH